jgi:hypothetical protein
MQTMHLLLLVPGVMFFGFVLAPGGGKKQESAASHVATVAHRTRPTQLHSRVKTSRQAGVSLADYLAALERALRDGGQPAVVLSSHLHMASPELLGGLLEHAFLRWGDQPWLHEVCAPFLRRWMKGDVRLLDTWLAGIPRHDAHLNALRTVAAIWVADDPVAALAWTGRLAEEKQGMVLSSMGEMLLLSHGEAALWQIARSDSAAREPLLSAMLEVLAEEQPARAWQIALSPPMSLSKEGMQAVAARAVRVKGRRAFAELEAAQGWQDNEKRAVAAVMMSAWAESDPASAAAWLVETPGQWQNATLVSGLAFNLLEADPSAAMAWMEIIPEEEVRLAGLQSVWSRWAQADPAAAQQWRLEHPAHEALLAEGGL